MEELKERIKDFLNGVDDEDKQEAMYHLVFETILWG